MKKQVSPIVTAIPSFKKMLLHIPVVKIFIYLLLKTTRIIVESNSKMMDAVLKRNNFQDCLSDSIVLIKAVRAKWVVLDLDFPLLNMQSNFTEVLLL